MSNIVRNPEDRFSLILSFVVYFQGTRAPVLKLSNLELGDYTFKLTVTDDLGNYAAAKVHVFLKSGNQQLLLLLHNKANNVVFGLINDSDQSEHLPSLDNDQTGGMPRLMCVFTCFKVKIVGFVMQRFSYYDL